MWGALLFGGRLVIMPTATTQSPDALYNILLTHSVTVLCQTPSAVRQLMEVRQTRDEPLALRIVTIALEVPLLDLSGSARADQQLAVRRIAAQTAQEPFDLQRGPLIRTRLLRLDTDQHLLLLVLHYTIADGWSLSIVWRELAALYAAAHSEQPSDLPELPIQYADVSHWQRQWLQGTVLETQLAYWRKQFADRPPALELPTDHPRPRTDLCRRGAALQARQAAPAAIDRGQPTRRRDAIYDPACRVQGRACTLQRADRCGRRHPDRQPAASRNAGHHRVFRQHPGVAAPSTATRRCVRCSGGYARPPWTRMHIKTCRSNTW